MAGSLETSAAKGGMKSSIIRKKKAETKRRKCHRREILCVGSFKPLAAELDLLLGEGCDPQAPLDDTLSGLEAVFRASVDEAKKALDNTSRCAIPFEVDQWAPAIAVNLGWLLCVVSQVVDVKAYCSTVRHQMEVEGEFRIIIKDQTHQ
jgi:hypothetical protein